MGLSKKMIKIPAATRRTASGNPNEDIDPSELGYVVFVQVLLFLISLVLMMR